MIQTLRLLLLFIYFNFLHSSYFCDDANSPYIIYTAEDFTESANILKEFHENEENVIDVDVRVPMIQSDNWLKQNLSEKSNIRKLMVLKEVLGKPRSIHPYTGDYYK